MNTAFYNRVVNLLHQEVKPALGCTEPVAVAIAVAKAVSLHSESDCESVTVEVSANILKNAMGVGIPGTSLTGLPVAIALAVACGKPEYGLEVLKDVNEQAVKKAQRYIDENRVKVDLSSCDNLLYAEACCTFADGHKSRAAIADAHDNVVFCELDGKMLFDNRKGGSNCSDKEDDGKFLSMSSIYEFACNVDLKDLDLMREQIRLNKALSEEGLKGNYGLNVGKTLVGGHHHSFFGNSPATTAMTMTAAASDARMAGCPLPAMSNSGSGNQGITVSMPVIAMAEYLGSSEEELLRALVLSNLVAIHIKSYLGKLSALCGCVVASTGSSCGIIMLNHGTTAQMAFAIQNMIGSITGMVCDGAKEGCALKVASGVSCALQSAVLALDNVCVQPTDGIIDKNVEESIKNLGSIGSIGMKETDKLILDIMLCK